ncbi:MAG: hypothetical protein HXS46_05440 [Theionarchaea archaeon]|nr:hypothetical protein [Theionarchaea archaeon]
MIQFLYIFSFVVFRPAITANAKFIVIVHNHPSGDPTPSKEDILLTQQLCMSGAIALKK